MNKRTFWRLVICVKLLFIGVGVGLYVKRTNAQRWFDMTASIDEDMVQSIYDAPKTELNLYNDSGVTGLMIAAGQGYLDLVRAFLDAGANPYLRQQFSYFGFTAIHLAAYYSRLDDRFAIVRYMLEWGVPIYIRDQIEETLAHVILYDVFDYDQRMKVMDYFIDQGIQINAQDAFGNTMLHAAVNARDKYWIDLFRTKYANLINNDIRNSLGLTLLEYANYLGSDDEYDSVGTALRKEVPIISGDQAYLTSDETGKTALMYALYRGDLALARQYIQQGANVNQQDNQGNTALHIAMSSLKPYDSVALLVNNGARVDSANNNGATPLSYVVRVEDPVARAQIVQLLKSKGAQNPSIDTQSGISFLDLLRRRQDTALIPLFE